MDTLLNLCRRLQTLTKLFRFAELCIILMFLLWTSTHLPFVVKISGEYCKKTFTLLLSPISIFFFGNAIVVCLLAKSGLFSGKSSSSIDNAVAQFYDELRSDGDNHIGNDAVVFQDKEIICEESTKSALPLVPAVNVSGGGGCCGGDGGEKLKVLPKEVALVVEKKASCYRRSKSEKVRKEEEEVKLRRSETDVCKWSIGGGGKELAAEMAAAEEEGVSGEEFRRTIEEFIAKQVKFHREESLAVVIHGQA